MARGCFYCDRPMIPAASCDGTRHRAEMETTDHIFPRSLVRAMPPQPDGWGKRNKVRACAGCNGKKADMHPVDWLATLRGNGRDRLRSRLLALGVSTAPASPC